MGDDGLGGFCSGGAAGRFLERWCAGAWAVPRKPKQLEQYFEYPLGRPEDWATVFCQELDECLQMLDERQQRRQDRHHVVGVGREERLRRRGRARSFQPRGGVRVHRVAGRRRPGEVPGKDDPRPELEIFSQVF